jgi:UDP-glucose:glycoprotein glucosyltransferase
MGSDKLLFAQFELQNIILEGNCFENGNPPRGLELVLQSNVSETVQDTIVMSNYGYFQLKANPGIWQLGLKEKSRSKLIYKFVGEAESRLFLSGFEGVVKRVDVQKYPERMHEQLLSDEPADNNLWGSISKYVAITTIF